MVSPDSFQATTDAALANERQGWKDLLADRDSELREAFARLKRWESEPCNRPGCRNLVPTKAQAEVWARYGRALSMGDALAINVGFCSSVCAEACREETKPVPFVLLNGGAQ